MKVNVYDRYRFASKPVQGVIIKKSKTNSGVEVKLLTTNNPRYPVGSTVWVSKQQCRAVLENTNA